MCLPCDDPGDDPRNLQHLAFRKEIRMGVQGCSKQHRRGDPQGEVGRSFCAVQLSTMSVIHSTASACDNLHRKSFYVHRIVSCDLSASSSSRIAIGHLIEAVGRNLKARWLFRMGSSARASPWSLPYSRDGMPTSLKTASCGPNTEQ